MSLTYDRRRRRPGRALGGTSESSGISSHWLWYEGFDTPDAAPVAASAAANPGPGTTHFSGSTGSISGGQYVEDVGASAAGPYQNTGYARTLGLACVAYGVNLSRLTSTIDVGFAASAGFGASSMRPGLAWSGSLTQVDGSTSQTLVGIASSVLTTGVAYDFCTIADTIGGFTFYRPSGNGTWTLLGVSRFDVTATIYARLRFFNAAGVCAGIGLATGVPMPQKYPLAASGVQGVYTLPTANFFAAMRLTTAGTNGIKFRRDGSGNYFLAQRTAAGQLNLTRYDAGSPTSVVNNAMTAAINDRIYMRLEGNAFRASGHPTGGTWVNGTGQTITQHSSNLGIEVLDESIYDSLEVYPFTGHVLGLPLAA